MHYIRVVPVAVITVFLAACGSSPTSPASPTAAPVTTQSGAPSTSMTSGHATDILSGAPLAAITIRLDDGTSATTAADGAFLVTAGETGLCPVTVSGAGVVSRETALRMPGSNASLALIPAQFDLATFDEMCRADGTLHRWSAAPSLVIVDAVLRFTGLSDSAFVALDERLAADERAAIAADLAWGLPQVTGGAFTSFASVSVESPAPGAAVNYFSREGRIVVASFRGLSQQTGYWGYGRWATRDVAVNAGAVMVDRDFETSGSPYLRSLRVHELGHALGYAHVTRRKSFMNSSAIYEPTAFDLDAARVAFQRPPGNQCPDRDPSRFQLGARAAGGLTWSAIIH